MDEENEVGTEKRVCFDDWECESGALLSTSISLLTGLAGRLGPRLSPRLGLGLARELRSGCNLVLGVSLSIGVLGLTVRSDMAGMSDRPLPAIFVIDGASVFSVGNEVVVGKKDDEFGAFKSGLLLVEAPADG